MGTPNLGLGAGLGRLRDRLASFVSGLFSPRGAASVRRSWILSYAVILALPLFVSMFVAFATHRVLQDQIRDSSSLVVELLGKELEGRLAYVSRLASDVASHPLTRLVLEGPSGNEGSFRSDLASLADVLAARASYDRYDDFLFLSLSKAGGVLLPRAYYSLEDFHRFHFEGTTTSLATLAALLRGRRDGSSLPLEFVDGRGRKAQVLAYLRSLPAQSSEPEGTLGILLDSEALVEGLHSSVRATGWEIRILDREGGLLLSSLAVDKIGSAMALGGQGARLRLDAGGGSGSTAYVSTWKALPSFGWTIQLLTPELQVWVRLWWVQAGTLAGLVLSLGLGIGLTAFWLRRNYQPVRHILGELSKRTGALPPASGNEFLNIESALIEAFEERYKAMERFDRHKSLLQENLAARILEGAEEGRDWEPSLAALDMDWRDSTFLVVLAEGDEDSEEAPEQRRGRHREALARLVGARGTVWPAAFPGESLYVIALSPAENASVLASELREATLPFLPLLSEAADAGASLPLALSQARAVRDHRYSAAGASILAFADIPREQTGQAYPLSPALEERLLNALRAGDEAAALGILDELRSLEGRGESGLAPQEARCLIWDLGASFLKALPPGILGPEARRELLGSLESIGGRKTVEDSLEGLGHLVRELCARVRGLQERHQDRQRTESARRLAEKVQAYLDARFRDPLLTLTGIAEELGYSAAYLSRFFKESREEGLMETLARLRVEHAKSLLRSSEAPLASVAQDCGFTDVNTFIRTFKKFLGITPGKYRETLE